MHFLKRIVSFVLTVEARIVLMRYKPRIIAVTGSVGKTTTKDAVFAALSGSVYVRKSEKSYNSDIGVPLTILGLENAWHNPFTWLLNIVRGLVLIIIPQSYPEWLVIEVGADRPGDIRSIARWLKPNIAIITAVPETPAHVEYFKSPEEVLSEKRSLAEHIKPGGKIILNADDARLRKIVTDFRGACITYGYDLAADYCASDEEILYENGKPTGMHFRLDHKGSSMPISTYGALGKAEVYAALAALATGEVVGIDKVVMSDALVHWEPPPGRMRIIEGMHGSVVIDDTYNASPAAVQSALETLRWIEGKRKIAVFGDMLELGRFSAEAHRAIGAQASHAASILWTIGFRAKAAAESAIENGMLASKVRAYPNDEGAQAGSDLAEGLKAGDVVLVKGSQAMRMERIVKAIMAHPDDAEDMLVRQEPEWQVR